MALGNVEHIVGIAGHPVYLTTNVAATLGGKAFREGPPRTLEEAVRANDPAIRSVALTAKRVGSFDVLCVDSGMDGAGTCGCPGRVMLEVPVDVPRPRTLEVRLSPAFIALKRAIWSALGLAG